METKYSYTIVGLFVIILGTAGFIIAIWLSVGLSGKKYNPYIVYMNESVSGLSIKAPVKYSGVEVGYVSDIDLRHYNPKQVQLLLEIQEGTPISVDTRAVLGSQGLTGIAFIELTGGHPASAPLLRQPGEKYPVIRSEPSLLFRLDAALDHLSKNLDSITSGLSSVLNRENTVAVKNILANLDHVSETLNKNAANMDKILKNTSQASQKLPSMVDNINLGVKNFNAITSEIAEASKHAKVTFSNTTATVESINDQILPQVMDAMSNVQTILENLKSITQQMDQDPSVIIRGTVPPAPGPGEK